MDKNQKQKNYKLLVLTIQKKNKAFLRLHLIQMEGIQLWVSKPAQTRKVPMIKH